jgi:23S rRNA (uracil1939-C5)-methyltransferase
VRVTIEKLAPTGEGIARTPDGVGFVAGALPGEEVEAEVEELRKNFWRGRSTQVHRASAHRVGGPHAGCPGCDWAHFDTVEALQAKKELFLETMERIGGQPGDLFGDLPAEASPPRYRLRNRWHVSGEGAAVTIGYFKARTHRVEPLIDCEAVSLETIALLPRFREGIARTGARVESLAILESSDSAQRLIQALLPPGQTPSAARGVLSALSPLAAGVEIGGTTGGARLQAGAPALTITIGGRPFPICVDTFIQANRFLVGRLSEAIRELARSSPSGRALDAFGGSGLFAGALLDAGHVVTTVEGSRSAVRDAERARAIWPDGNRWDIVSSDVASFVARQTRDFDLAVVDPPRAGLGLELSGLLARRVASRILYVSCEPATLARDLPAILEKGFRISGARLYDLFAATHRIEAILVLDRRGRT